MTIRGNSIRVPDAERLVHLQFRRYAGCPVCNLHLRSVARRHADLLTAGIREVVVFHSTAETMQEFQGELPFAAIADSAQRLYAEFGVGKMSPPAFLRPRSLRAAGRALTRAPSLRGATGRGEEHLGLPAEFLIHPDGRVLAVTYGRYVDDHWSVDELLDLARSRSLTPEPSSTIDVQPVNTEEEAGMNGTRNRSFVRVTLLILALPQLAIALWALAAPRGWFETFPGGGKAWLPLYGPYDEHLVRDVGSTFLGLGALLLLAAVWMDRRVVQAAVVAYLAYQLPHGIYHFGADERLPRGDQILNGISLGLAVLLAAGALALSGRPRRRPAGSAAGSAPNGAGRLGLPPSGQMARGARWYGRRRFGRAPATIDAYLHHPRLLMGYGTFESAVEGSDRVDERLKSLAELRAASLVGCEWCMDFGSWLSRGHGVPERQLRELPLYHESDAFSDLERLVLDYASLMTRTPAEVGDDLFARLREHFDDAQLVELTNVIAVENLRARFNDALALDPQGFSEGGFCVIPERAAAPASDRG